MMSCRRAVPCTLLSADASHGPALHLQYRLSMCCTSPSKFFGRTWSSQELPLSPLDTSGMFAVTSPVVVYFHSTIRDDNCVVVVETVVVVRDRVTDVRLCEFGVGWAALNLLSPGRRVDDWDPHSRTRSHRPASPSSSSLLS
jgi:hypothetical protein